MIKNILEEIRNIKSQRKQLEEFAWVMGGFFALLAGMLFLKHRFFLPWGILSAVFFVAGFAAPQALLPLQKAWMAIAVIIGFFMSRIILSVLFFLVITPIAVCTRWSGKKFLAGGESPDTYWQQHPEIQDRTSYQRQY